MVTGHVEVGGTITILLAVAVIVVKGSDDDDVMVNEGMAVSTQNSLS